MESTDPRVRQLENIAEKQMKTMLHSRFLQNCRQENVIPKGLRLKLKIHVGTECRELQKAVDDLLWKVSGDICDRIQEFQQRRSEEFGREMDSVRTALKKTVSSDTLFDIDSNISHKTESKKNEVLVRHEKKLRYLKETLSSNVRDLGSDKVINGRFSNDTRQKEKRQKPRNPRRQRQTTQHKSGDPNQVVSGTPSRQSSGRDKNKDPQTTSASSPNQPSSEPNQHQESGNISKNGGTPGTYKTYSEAVKSGAANHSTSIQTTMETLMLAVTNIQTMLKEQNAPRKGQDKGASYVHRTERHGVRPKRDFRKSGKGKKQF